MLIRIERIIRTESYLHCINHVGTPWQADITGKSNPFIIVELPELVQTVQETFIQQFFADKLRISFKAPEYECSVNQGDGRTPWWLFRRKVDQSPTLFYAALHTKHRSV